MTNNTLSDRAREAAIAMWNSMADAHNQWGDLSFPEQDAMTNAFASFEREITQSIVAELEAENARLLKLMPIVNDMRRAGLNEWADRVQDIVEGE